MQIFKALVEEMPQDEQKFRWTAVLLGTNDHLLRLGYSIKHCYDVVYIVRFGYIISQVDIEHNVRRP